MIDVPLSVLQLVGSAVDYFHVELSWLYARDCTAALHDHHQMHVAFVSPDGSWRFPTALSGSVLQRAQPMSLAQAIDYVSTLDVDVVVPQMFCRPGMTAYRGLLELMGLRYLGNTPQVMANAADKPTARAIVSAAGVKVPAGQIVQRGQDVTLPPPVVVKPTGADNSMGVTLVEDAAGLDAAVVNAATLGPAVLVESFIPPGREVRCAILERGGRLEGLPLQEYTVDRDAAPIRRTEDKLARTESGELFLVAKDSDRAWIVPADDPINEPVWQAARLCYRALGCRHYGLFDFRIDPDGSVWFLEAGLYCSFAPSSVVATMAAAAGLSLPELFAAVCHEAGVPTTP